MFTQNKVHQYFLLNSYMTSYFLESKYS